MTCAGVKVVYQCLNVEYMYMWYREIECACRKVVHTAHRFNHEAVGWIVHIELGVCVCVCVRVRGLWASLQCQQSLCGLSDICDMSEMHGRNDCGPHGCGLHPDSTSERRREKGRI